MNCSVRFNYFLPILAICAALPFHANGQAVPSSYQAIYTLDQNYLQNFMTGTLTASGTPPTYAGMQCGSLKVADSNVGPSLLTSDPTQQLNALAALGVPCIMVHINFPMLYEPFLTGQSQSQAAFVSFYSSLTTQIHGMGMKMVVENTAMLTNAVSSEAGWDTAPFYATLNWTQYEQARATTALTIAQSVQPDYLVVMEEPDTEAMNSGQPNVNTPSGANDMLSQIAGGLQTSRQNGMLIGAGVGSWLPGFLPFIQDYVTQPIDFIDMHVYPVNDSFLPNALTIASTAAAANLPVAMTECWLNKELDSEVIPGVLTIDQINARDVFSFWAPLDQLFLQTMQTMASYIQVNYGNQFLFIDPFASDYFWGYQTYNTQTSAETPAALLAGQSSLDAQNNQGAVYSTTGTSFYNTVILTPDTTPPTAPPNLSGGSDNPTTASLSWNESTDNVGVAGYYVFRNGVQIATTALLEPGVSPLTVIYQDSGLTEATNYTYTVEAFDLAGNVSPASAPITITTTDVTPPTTPTNLAAAAAACTRVTLTWTASTDKLGISNYKIFAGLSPSSMIQIGMQGPSPTSYNDQTVSPGTTYYYALQAVDTSGNLSYMTTPVPINTPALPVAPAGVTATPNSGTKVTVKWSPSTGGMSIAHYNVFRGNSATSLAQYAQTTGTTYNDMAATPSTTYYYAVQASDTGSPASQSGLSAPVVSATTYPSPGPPTNVTAVGASTTRITLSWTAPVTPGGLSIANYRIFRGPSSTNLTQITTVTKSPYNDQNLTPNTTYYYGIEAVDTGVPADVGTMSTPVAGSTYGNPNPPTNVAAAPASSSKITVTWAAAVPNGLKISNYHVYGGASCSSLTQLGITTALTYNQMSLSPDTTYYYAVQATDTGGDVSAMSTCVSATTYPLPTTPSNVTATAKSTTMMSVSWSASTGSLTIKYYYVSRGLTPTSLSQVATTSNLSFTDQNLTPGTTYYYSIQASDTAGDRSASSPPVAGTTNP